MSAPVKLGKRLDYSGECGCQTVMMNALVDAIPINQVVDLFFRRDISGKLSPEWSANAGNPLFVSRCGSAAFERVMDALQQEADGVDERSVEIEENSERASSHPLKITIAGECGGIF